MIIDENLLLQYGANYEKYNCNDLIFHEGDQPRFYYQIVKGTIEVSNYHDGGRECLYNIMTDGQCIGESLLFIDRPYQSNAIAKSKITLLKLAKTQFLELLANHPDATARMFKCLAEGIYFNHMMVFNMTSPDPCFKIKTVMEYYKNCNLKKSPYSYQIPFTRKQIANLIGLCTETVIRNVKKMERKQIIKIENGKIYY
ncbi:Crp/Fnr family transcriptional regulator [Chryseobacterium fluminis]|uniref:Crp/Fnr family transcriptional regulator n=1 Tax=Chryseobacterium fluminis TaxID=2983606 RepID=UPI0022550963|nr:Crp/Fnr family transcriptional regulator [Chryseobacterium sp. MMS21-Ot14]UZT99077.1 Crp/Fnr family transcriptional regulator [Chryseobacterium sp. MMS21-Ot14]